MNMENKLARIMRNTGPARFFVPVGLILIIVGIILMCMTSGNLVETVGTVTKVEESTNDENQKEYTVHFTYTVDGTVYPDGKFENLSKSYKEGDDIKVFYDPDKPDVPVADKSGRLIGIIMIGVGVLATAFGVWKTVKAFQKSKELDKTPKAAPVEFEGFKTAPGVTEYYCRHDGSALKPGYILEDGARKVLFEGKMLKQAVIGARVFEFTNHTNGRVEEHEVGHTMTQSYNDEFFSVKSWFKFDGKNIWDLLHEKGLRMNTNLRGKFPNLIYEISKDGSPFARLETSGKYVHEDEAAEHKLNIPVGKYYYRVWTNSNDIETLFLTIFAISETEQTVVE